MERQQPRHLSRSRVLVRCRRDRRDRLPRAVPHLGCHRPRRHRRRHDLAHLPPAHRRPSLLRDDQERQAHVRLPRHHDPARPADHRADEPDREPAQLPRDGVALLPLAALAAALPCVDAPYVALLAADLPFLDSETVTRLRAAAADRDGALLVDDEGVNQILVGVWRSSALRDALGSITGGPLRRVLGRLEPARMHVPAGPAPGPAPWFDCDTPDDLRVARARA